MHLLIICWIRTSKCVHLVRDTNLFIRLNIVLFFFSTILVEHESKNRAGHGYAMVKYGEYKYTET